MWLLVLSVLCGVANIATTVFASSSQDDEILRKITICGNVMAALGFFTGIWLTTKAEKSLDVMRSDVDGIRSDMDGIRSDIDHMKSDITDLKSMKSSIELIMDHFEIGKTRKPVSCEVVQSVDFQPVSADPDVTPKVLDPNAKLHRSELFCPVRPQIRPIREKKGPVDENDPEAVIADLLDDIICTIEDEEYAEEERLEKERFMERLPEDIASGHVAKVEAERSKKYHSEVPDILRDTVAGYNVALQRMRVTESVDQT